MKRANDLQKISAAHREKVEAKERMQNLMMAKQQVENTLNTKTALSLQLHEILDKK